MAIICIAIVSMGSGDRVGNAVRGGHTAHFDSHVPGLGTVVDFGQNVAMDIDHECIFTFRFVYKNTCASIID